MTPILFSVSIEILITCSLLLFCVVVIAQQMSGAAMYELVCGSYEDKVHIAYI